MLHCTFLCLLQWCRDFDCVDDDNAPNTDMTADEQCQLAMGRSYAFAVGFLSDICGTLSCRALSEEEFFENGTLDFTQCGHKKVPC